MRNTADVTGGKPFAVGSQSIADVSAVNPYTFNHIHRRKGEVLFLLGVFVSFYYVFVFFVIYFSVSVQLRTLNNVHRGWMHDQN
jgi:hypothetical protein